MMKVMFRIKYKLLVDNWQLYDNSSSPTVLLDES